MVPAKLFTDLQQLGRADKLRIMQFLVIELAKDEGVLLKPDTDYPIWSPYQAYEAANTLLALLNSDSQSPDNASA